MRHGRKNNHLGRQAAHRDALFMNLANSLIKHKRIKTTVAKAKALRKYLEPLVTKSKNDTTHSRRIVFSYLNDKEAVAELFRDISVKVAERDGGYLRIIKLGNREGDNAEMAMIEFVDFNENTLNDTRKSSAATKKRTRRGATTAKPGAEKTTAQKKETVAKEVKEEVTEDAPAKTEETTPDENNEQAEA